MRWRMLVGDLTRIDNVGFTLEDSTAFEKQAREKAMADAKATAQQLASLSEVGLGKPIYISESSQVPIIYRSLPMVKAADASSTPISAGELDVMVTVNIVYAIAD